MDMFLITLVIIASVIIVIAGYVAPYIALWFYAMKRKTTVKSLSLLIKKYDSLSDYFAFSLFMGYFISAVFLLIIYLDSTESPLPYNDMLLGSIGFPILFVVLMLWALSYFIKDSLDITNDKLVNQSIKI